MKTFLFLLLMSFSCFSSSQLSLEGGQATNTYNKVKISGDDGTLFNLAPSIEKIFYYRLSYLYHFKSKHGLRFLYAPLKFSGDRKFSKDIDFLGVNFDQGEKTETEYQFNSYRATYFYRFIEDENFKLNAGGTLKVRDALVKLKQGDKSKTKSNTGVVPLIYLTSEYSWNSGVRVGLDFDGLIAPQGRAFDVALMGGYNFSHSLQANIGFRMLEGGADNENVYNFSQVNYLFSSLLVTF